MVGYKMGIYPLHNISSFHYPPLPKNRRNRIRLQTSLVKEKLEKEKKEELIQAKQEFLQTYLMNFVLL